MIAFLPRRDKSGSRRFPGGLPSKEGQSIAASIKAAKVVTTAIMTTVIVAASMVMAAMAVTGVMATMAVARSDIRMVLARPGTRMTEGVIVKVVACG